MVMTQVPPTIWVFTEHHNATYLINFDYPHRGHNHPLDFELRRWTAADLRQSAWATLETQLSGQLLLHRPDVVVFSRYIEPFGEELQALFRQAGITQFFHIDDLLHAIPPSLGQKYRDTYSETFAARLKAFIAGCDGVLASTATLAAQMRQRHPNIPVKTLLGVCFMDPQHWPLKPLKSRAKRLVKRLSHRLTHTIGYMGSASHQRDLETIRPALAELLRSDQSLRFETLGIGMPEELRREFGPRVRQFGFTSDYIGFLRTLYELGWDLGLAPLVADEFNAAKTATKFVEYTACGMPTIAQAISPYATLPEDAIYTAGTQDWVARVKSALADDTGRARTLARAQALCRVQFSPTASVRQLMEQAIPGMSSFER